MAIPEKFEALITELKKRYASGEMKAYKIADVQRQNPDLETKQIQAWTKKVTGQVPTDYLVSVGIISLPEYYPDDIFAKITLEEVKGKTFYVWGSEESAELVNAYGGTVAAEYDDGFDYLLVYRDAIRKSPPEEWSSAGLTELVEGLGEKRTGRVVNARSLWIEHHKILEARCKTPEERRELGLLVSETYNPPQPTEPAKNPEFKVVSRVDEKDIPVFDPEALYWTLKEFENWFEGGGWSGFYEGDPLKRFSISEKSKMEGHRIQRAFEQFAHLCRSLHLPEVQAYICQRVAKTKDNHLALNRVLQVASLGYIGDFEGSFTLVAKNTARDTITVSLQKRALAKHYDGGDFTSNKDGIDGIPPELLEILFPPEPLDCPRRNQPGYYFLDSESGEIPEAVFANDPTIKYVEFSDRIREINSRAFANCSELEEIYFGPRVAEIGRSFKECKKIKKVVFPDSVETISGSFEACEALEEVVFSKFSSCERLWGAFSGCKSLKKVVIPDLVKVISSDAFKNCESLESVELPRICWRLESKAFAGCTSLTTVSCANCYASKVKYERDAFADCPNLVLDSKLEQYK